MKLCYFLIAVVAIVQPLGAQLFINEFMASNSQTVADANGEYDDWIELYNAADFDINLKGYYLTDDFSEPKKWAFPPVVIAAKDYLLIWADNDPGQSGLHTNFKLSKNGEQIAIYDSIACVDSITFGVQSTDVSFGRESDGASHWVFFAAPENPPSPEAANVYTAVKLLAAPIFTPDEGFYSGTVTVAISTNEPGAVIYYTTDGSIPTQAATQYNQPLTFSVPTTIRAVAHKKTSDGNDLVSDVVTKCYLVNIDHRLPLMAVACDSAEFDKIYNPPFYRPGKPHPSITAHFKYFDDNNILQGDLPIAISLHGGYSIRSPKKSHKIIFTKQNFRYDLFDQEIVAPRLPELPASFKSFYLLGMAADYSLIRNYLSMQLLRNAG